MSDTGPQRAHLLHFLETLRSPGGFDLEWTLSEPGPGSLAVELSGPDLPLLLDRNGELLHAIESLAASILHLEGDQAEQLSIDAGGFRAARAAQIEQQAREAVDRVRSTAEPFLFPPMNARERRLLHLALQASGLPTASSGDGPRRFVVLYPEGATPEPERFAPPPAPRRDGFRPGGGFRRDSGPRRDSDPGSRREGSRARGPWQDRPRFDRPRPASGRGRDPNLTYPSPTHPSPENFGNRHDDPEPSPAYTPADDLPGERRHRPVLDPNGNPIETPTPTADPTVEARLRKLRENFRQR